MVCLLPLAFDREHVSWFWEEKIDAKTTQKHFTEYDISSLYVRYNFHYAVSCTRFPAVRYCTNMGQMLFLTYFRPVFCALSSFRYGCFIIDLYRFVSILYRFFIDFCG